MIKVRFDFPCGATRVYPLMSDSIRGIRVNNNRPTVATIYSTSAPDAYFIWRKFLSVLDRCIIPALHPVKGKLIIEDSVKHLVPTNPRKTYQNRRTNRGMNKDVALFLEQQPREVSH